MEDALRRHGITNRVIERGHIYRVFDKIITLPKNRLSAHTIRQEHLYRLVLILQTDVDNSDVTYPIVLVAPLSHRVDLKDDKDYFLNKGEGGIDQDSLVQLGLIQPILKRDLVDAPLGKLNVVKLSEIDAVLAANIGLIER